MAPKDISAAAGKGIDTAFAQLTSLISPTSRFLVSEPEPFASGGGPELAGVHGAEMVSAAATALPATVKVPEALAQERPPRASRKKRR